MIGSFSLNNSQKGSKKNKSIKQALSDLDYNVFGTAHSVPGLSPYKLLPLLVVSVFCSEIIIMFALHLFPALPTITEAFVDATMLLVILSPTFYFFHYRPLVAHYIQRKNIIDQLVESEEQLDLTLDAVNDGLWDWDFKAESIYFSPRWERMLGYEPGSIEPKVSSWDALIHLSDKKKVFRDLDDHLLGKSEYFESEYRMKTKYGDWRWILTRGKVVTRDLENTPLRAVGTNTDIHSRKVAEEGLQQREKDIRRLSWQLIESSEVESKRLAQDLHDDFGQLLTALKLGVEMIQNHQIKEEDELQFHCARLLGTVDRMAASLSHVCDNLRPVMLDDIGLIATLKWFVKDMEQQAGTVKINLESPADQKRLPPDVELVCFRICQEAINNALKHAAPTEINVKFRFGSKTATILISDNGKGFDLKKLKASETSHWGFGLLGMNERAAAVDGYVGIDSTPGKGTRVEVVLPVFID